MATQAERRHRRESSELSSAPENGKNEEPLPSRRSGARANIGLSDAELEGSIKVLNRALANASLLGVKTKKFHWDVVGPQFMTLHELWDDQYEKLAAYQDEIAERVRTLGGFPLGTLAGFLRHTTLEEYPGDVPSATEAIAKLLHDHEHVVRDLRDGIDECEEAHGDKGTADFLTGMMQEHEKMAWMLRSFLQGESVVSDGETARGPVPALA
jgi:starvation-inducible DNA-binding protein